MITVLVADKEEKVQKIVSEMLGKLGNTSILISREADTIQIMEKEDIRRLVPLADKVVELGRTLYAEKKGVLYRAMVEAVEKPMIEYVLQQTEGNQLKAARILGLNRNTIRARIKKLGIDATVWKV